MFLFGISVGWQVIAMEGQKKLMNIRVKPGPGGGG
jgi:prophage tail gpP-like protein